MEGYKIVKGVRGGRTLRSRTSLEALKSLLDRGVCDAVILTSSRKHHKTITEHPRSDHAYLIASSKKSFDCNNPIRIYYPSRRHCSYRLCKSAAGPSFNVYIGTVTFALLVVMIAYFVTKIYPKRQ